MKADLLSMREVQAIAEADFVLADPDLGRISPAEVHSLQQLRDACMDAKGKTDRALATTALRTVLDGID